MHALSRSSTLLNSMLALLLITAATASAATTHRPVAGASSHKKPTHSTSAHVVAHGRSTATKRGAHSRTATHPATAPQHMEPERATAIQQALIRDGYMSGEPSGEWDSDSQAAMRKMQGDNGWQTKIVPDSRALIKLGLGSQQ